ncbi:NADH-quinone oxidoreductase subunit A [Candidatus Chlorohelix allophototropha]|jgi:NADH-quinone oxidoreductase subunit A|uniref:NADH-quinone oxidoreductase subunit A n=2 Tax=Candidatus Chlorohelix allophototropha TaxID=3003348 RepID=A0ABY9B0R3_9CHLR|nr:NADH-quinone oxidoreductase subunit A [Chloroflexota bacterium L227-S17]
MSLEDFNLAYLSTAIFLVVITIMGMTLLLLGFLIRPNKPNSRKTIPYESGVPPVGHARERYSVRFYIIAMLFVLFDIEAVFLYPWAINFDGFVRRGDGLFVLIEMGIFIFVILLGYAYAWLKGALDWVF